MLIIFTIERALAVTLCITLCGVLHARLAADEGLLWQRIHSQPKAEYYYNKLSDAGRGIVAQLDTRSRELNTLPSRSDTIRILGATEVTLTQLEWLYLETIIRDIQQPYLSSEGLVEKYKAFARAVPELNCEYRVISHLPQGRTTAPKSSTILSCEFSIATDKSIFFTQSGAALPDNVVRKTWLFNGVEMHEIEEAFKGLSNEYIFVAPHLRAFYPDHHPFTAARIAPEEAIQDRNVRQECGFTVFSDTGAFVFETPEVRDGKELVACGASDWVILLDPELNYAIVEERFGELSFNQKYTLTPPHHIRRNSKFVQLADGAYIPQHSVLKIWRHDRTIHKHIETVVNRLELHPEQSLKATFARPERLHINNNVTGKSKLSVRARPGNVKD